MFSLRTKLTRFPKRIEKHTPRLFATGTDARRLGLFCFLAATSQGFCPTFANKIDDAGVIDWRRKIAGNELAEQMKLVANDVTVVVLGYRSLDSRRKTERNDRRAGEIPLKPAINRAEDFGTVINL